MSIAENLASIQEAIRKAGGKDVRVEGVIKGQTVDKVIEGVKAGLTVLGCNYVQEGASLRAGLPDFKGDWHFIGHIQSRKARDLVSYDCVESLDRGSVAEELSHRAGNAGRKIRVFAEVNIGEEASKSGVLPTALEPFLDSLLALPHLKVDGLMALPPPLDPVGARRPHFKAMRQLFDRFEKSHGLRWLSVGTSEDYREAVSEGANLVRLGTILFGARPPKIG